MFKQMNIEHSVVYMIRDIPDEYPAHSYLVFKRGNQYHWFEHSWQNKNGIHGPFDSVAEVAEHVHDEAVKQDGGDNRWSYGLLAQPEYGIGCREYMDFAARCIPDKKCKSLKIFDRWI